MRDCNQKAKYFSVAKMDQRKSSKRRTKQRKMKRIFFSFRQCCCTWSSALIVKTIFLLCVINLLEQRKGRATVVVSGSGFPGTIKHHSTNSANDWWQTSASTNGSNDPDASKTNNEEDDGNKSDEESESSSSEWEWNEEEDNKGGGSSASTEESDLEDNDASDGAKPPVEATTTSPKENEEFRESDTKSFVKRSNNRSLPPSPSRTNLGGSKEKSTSPKSSPGTAGVSNKPLQTLEKLQQMLDETDYLTSSSSAREAAASIIAEDFSSDEGEVDDDEEVDDVYDARMAEVQEQVQTPTPLWTSKDRSKYKRQIRQQQQRRQPKQYPPPPGGERQSSRPPPRRQAPPQQYLPPNPYYRRQEYYQQQARIQQQQQQARLQQQQQQQNDNIPKSTVTPKPPRSPYDGSATSDVEDPDDETDLDDGLGYILPNLPVYLSDAEDSDYEGVISSSSTTEAAAAAAASASSKTVIDNSASSSQQQQSPPSPPQSGTLQATPLQQGQHQQITPANELMLYPTYSHQTYSHDQQGWYHHHQQQQQQVPPSSYYVPNNMMQPPPPGYYYPIPPPQGGQSQPQQQQQQQQHPGHPQYGPYNYGAGNWYPPTPYQHHYGPRPYVPRIDTTTATNNSKNKYNARLATKSSPVQQAAATITGTRVAQYPLPLNGLEVAASAPTQQAPSTRLSFRSVLKLSLCILCSTLLCYAAVSPRNLSMLEYNLKFYENLRIAALTIAAPLFLILIVVDTAENNINNLIGGFANAFTYGYLGCFASQVVAATIIRLGVFLFWEPNVFDLAPMVPLPIIPWVIREHKYRPKRITLFIQDFITSCVACPLLEEFFKLFVLQRSVNLSTNFNWVTRRSKSNKKKKRVADPVMRVHPDDKEVTNVNHYVSNMLAVSMGLKLADSIRRVCMYTKEGQQADRAFFALFRGIFPIHELCGTVTALSLARRDVLGQPMPMWKLLLPSAIIHGMANFRGMKPIFKWNSATPWSEMQLSPNFMTENTTFAQLAAKAFPKVMWLIILCRVAGYCVKNYYMINRQAVKRTTTFAGKHSAFSAELAAAEKLKASKKKKD